MPPRTFPFEMLECLFFGAKAGFGAHEWFRCLCWIISFQRVALGRVVQYCLNAEVGHSFPLLWRPILRWCVRTIVVVVVHLPMLRRVLVEISMVRRDLCHFRVSSLAEHCFTHPFVSGDAPRFFLLRFSKSCSADRFPFSKPSA